MKVCLFLSNKVGNELLPSTSGILLALLFLQYFEHQSFFIAGTFISTSQFNTPQHFGLLSIDSISSMRFLTSSNKVNILKIY